MVQEEGGEEGGGEPPVPLVKRARRRVTALGGEEDQVVGKRRKRLPPIFATGDWQMVGGRAARGRQGSVLYQERSVTQGEQEGREGAALLVQEEQREGGRS